jgi:mono/diheme cytochrome c family protein
MRRLVVMPLLSVLLASAGMAQERDELRERGGAIARSMCAQCHAVGATGRSPHPGAPAFRTLEQRLDLDSFMERLREGLMSGHPDMPMFRFTREDARALIAYLRSIQ